MRLLIIIVSALLLCSCSFEDFTTISRAPNLSSVKAYELADIKQKKREEDKKVARIEEESSAGFDDIYTDIEYRDGTISEKNKKAAIMPGAKASNSLWENGSRTFFRNRRARSVGDLIKVVLTVSGQAQFNNKTETIRNNTENSSVENALGFEKYLTKALPGGVTKSSLINALSAGNNTGEGKIKRDESMSATVTATVVRILPSNNIVLRGTQEVRVNREVRQITIEGIARPEDITSDNSILLEQIAEARVSYGGKGDLTTVQSPRYGKKVIDLLSPF